MVRQKRKRSTDSTSSSDDSRKCPHLSNLMLPVDKDITVNNEPEGSTINTEPIDDAPSENSSSGQNSDDDDDNADDDDEDDDDAVDIDESEFYKRIKRETFSENESNSRDSWNEKIAHIKSIGIEKKEEESQHDSSPTQEMTVDNDSEAKELTPQNKDNIGTESVTQVNENVSNSEDSAESQLFTNAITQSGNYQCTTEKSYSIKDPHSASENVPVVRESDGVTHEVNCVSVEGNECQEKIRDNMSQAEQEQDEDEEEESGDERNDDYEQDGTQESDLQQGRDSSCAGYESMALREFDVLDEFDHNDEEEDDQDDYNQSDDDSDVPDEEIEAMLEEGLPEEFKKKTKNGENAESGEGEPSFRERKKVVLEELDHNHFEMLPDGWVQVNHNSGMPVFLHKQSRVCTLAKPYFLGPGSARKHEIPLSAIPCLQYRRALEAKKETTERNSENQSENADGTQPENNNAETAGFPNASIETLQENKERQSLSPTQVREYCEKLFQFKVVKVLRFKSWTERRKYTKQKKQYLQLQRPTLPEGTKLIKFPIQNSGCRENGHPRKEWIMNPNGKSYVCILHEYVQHALKKQPSYKFKELENAGTPYSATVSINGMQYGVGFGTSKKQAKSEAAKATLEILIPEMREKIQSGDRGGAKTDQGSSDSYLSIFDEIKIEDPRVAELCAKTTEPSPYAILLTCLQRNFGMGEMHIKYEVNALRHQRNEFMMTVGRHTAKVICKNKRDGKQRASQSILQALHPHITSWGSLLRLYGSRSVKSMKEKKQEEQEITLLQSKAAINSPNFAILNKLKTEMKKLRDMKASIQPIGKFIPPDDVDLPSSSGVDLNSVDL